MKLEEIIRIMQNKVDALSNTRNLAYNAGDLEKMINLDQEISITQDSIEKIRQAMSQSSP
jgi:hypothetical protein